MITSLVLIILVIQLFLGIFVLIQDTTNQCNRLFFLLSLSAASWTASNHLADKLVSLSWLQTSYAFGSLVICIGLMWTSIVTSIHTSQRRLFTYLLFGISFAFLSFQTNFIAESYNRLYSNIVYSGQPGWGLSLYAIFYLTFSFLILFKLRCAIKNSHSVTKRLQYKCIFVGASISIFVTTINAFVFPHNSIFLSSIVDGVGFLIFMLIIIFSIVKYQLFNIKLIFIQIVLCALWIFMFTRVIFSTSFINLIIETGLFIITLAVGILFLKSVLQSIKQRKEIEDLTSSLNRAYEFIERDS